jgi:hypothetical protein
MLRLYQSLAAWGTGGFESVLKQEIAGQAEHLPLQQALSSSSSVADVPVTVLILSVAELESVIRVKVGIFYSGATGGCACANDPTPESNATEYCEALLEIDRESAATTVVLLKE